MSTKLPVLFYFVLITYTEPEATAVGAASEVMDAGSPPTQMVCYHLYLNVVDNTRKVNVAELVQPAAFSITTITTLLSSKV